MLHGLTPGHLQLHENMIIGAADKDSRLLHSDLLHQLKILLTGTNPAGNLREFISPLHTLIHRIPILLAVQKKFAGTDHSVWTAQLM